MASQDTSPLKEKIVSFIRRNGPSLPVHIAKEVELSTLFTSAFLSEIISEKRIRTSNMKVGSSPLYLIPGQEPQLEKFSQYLKSKEKEAFLRLKEKKILRDSEQEPAIRVALREIRDFAIPFRKSEQGELFWRFLGTPKSELSETESKPESRKEPPQQNVIVPKEEPKEQEPIQKLTEKKILEKEIPKESQKSNNDLGIFDESRKEEKEAKEERPIKSKKSRKKKSNAQRENNFFTKVKEFLANSQIDLIDILTFNKNEIIISINQHGQDKILVAYNKRKITENDIIKASKKAQELNRKYIVLSAGTPLKRTSELIEATKNLSSIEKL